MPAASDFYVPGESWLHRLDPRGKLLLVLLSIPMLLLYQSLPAMVVALSVSLLMLVIAKVPVKRWVFILRALLPVNILMPLIWVIFYPRGEILFQIGAFNFSLESFLQGWMVAFRIDAMAFVVFLVFFTTKPMDLVRGLVKLKIPYAWGLVFSLVMRYIPSLQANYQVITQAHQSRGLELEKARGISRARKLLPILVTLMIASFRSSDMIAIALEARGFGGRSRNRTQLHELRMKSTDAWFILLILLIAATLLYLNLRVGFGSELMDPFN